MVVVTGASGVLGENTINFLLTELKPNQIIGFVRDIEKTSDLDAKGVTIKKGDYSDYSSLVAAFKGADKLFLVSSPDVVNRLEHHKNVINAAKEVGIKHVVYTAMQKPKSDYQLVYSTEPDKKTIELIEASGIKFTILYNTSYIDYIPYFIGNSFPQNTLRMPGGEGKAAYASRADLGEANAKILLHSEKYEGKHITLTGSQALSYQDIAAILSEVTGNAITYSDVTAEQYIKERTESGMPDMHAAYLSQWIEGIKNNVFEEVYPDLENILGKKPHTVANLLKQTYAGNTPKTSGQIATEYLKSAGVQNTKTTVSLFANDGLFEIPYSKSLGMNIKIQGQKELEEYLNGAFAGASKFQFINIRIVLETENKAVVEYETDFVLDNGRPYKQHLIAIFETENGKVKLHREFIDTVVAAKAILPNGIETLI